MKFETLIGMLGGGAKVVGTASSAAMLAGLVYLVDCRISAKGPNGVDRCYFTALPMMGIGIAGRGGFQVGYQTYNPKLRREEEGERERDEHGRFTKKRRNSQ